MLFIGSLSLLFWLLFFLTLIIGLIRCVKNIRLRYEKAHIALIKITDKILDIKLVEIGIALVLFLSIFFLPYPPIAQAINNFLTFIVTPLADYPFSKYFLELGPAALVSIVALCGVLNIMAILKAAREKKKKDSEHLAELQEAENRHKQNMGELGGIKLNQLEERKKFEEFVSKMQNWEEGDKEQFNELKKLGAELLQTRSGELYYLRFSRSLDYYKKLCDDCYALKESIEKLDNDIIEGFEDFNQKFFDAFALLIGKAVKEFFKIETVGFNFMLFLDVEKDSKHIEALFSKIKVLGPKKTDPNLMRGVLFLPKELNLPLDDTAKDLELVMPVYSHSKGRRDKYNPSITPPGAPRAFFDGTSTIKNTEEDISFCDVERVLKGNCMEHFAAPAIMTRTLISLSIHEKHPEEMREQDCIAILNIEGPKAEAFHQDNELIEAFYAAMYPSMKLAAKYLKYHKKYLENKI